MKRNDFKNPLIKSGILLLIVFFLISIVANSGESGLFGSISALVSGLLSSIVFIIGLCLAIIVSLVIITGLFIAAVSIHSVDKARDMYHQLINSLRTLYGKITGSSLRPSQTFTDDQSATENPVSQTPAATAQAVTSPPPSEQILQFEKTVKKLETAVEELQSAARDASGQIVSLQDNIAMLQENAVEEKIDSLENKQNSLEGELSKLSASLDTNGNKIKELESTLKTERENVQAELKALQEKTSIPEVVSGILSYIDLPEDRDKITEKAEEAVSRGMTYSQIDEFFKSNLAPGVYNILADHPRLTKDFIRSIKKKFD